MTKELPPTILALHKGVLTAGDVEGVRAAAAAKVRLSGSLV